MKEPIYRGLNAITGESSPSTNNRASVPRIPRVVPIPPADDGSRIVVCIGLADKSPDPTSEVVKARALTSETLASMTQTTLLDVHAEQKRIYRLTRPPTVSYGARFVPAPVLKKLVRK